MARAVNPHWNFKNIVCAPKRLSSQTVFAIRDYTIIWNIAYILHTQTHAQTHARRRYYYYVYRVQLYRAYINLNDNAYDTAIRVHCTGRPPLKMLSALRVYARVVMWSRQRVPFNPFAPTAPRERIAFPPRPAHNWTRTILVYIVYITRSRYYVDFIIIHISSRATAGSVGPEIAEEQSCGAGWGRPTRDDGV